MSCKYCLEDLSAPCKQCGGVMADEFKALQDKLAAFQYPPEHRVSVAERERDEALRRLDRLLDRVREMKYEPHKLQELIDSFGVVERRSPFAKAAKEADYPFVFENNTFHDAGCNDPTCNGCAKGGPIFRSSV
jgi:hypothetical protein